MMQGHVRRYLAAPGRRRSEARPAPHKTQPLLCGTTHTRHAHTLTGTEGALVINTTDTTSIILSVRGILAGIAVFGRLQRARGRAGRKWSGTCQVRPLRLCRGEVAVQAALLVLQGGVAVLEA